MLGETSSTLTVKPVKLDTRNNFTCQAVNEGGVSESATVFVNVSGKFNSWRFRVDFNLLNLQHRRRLSFR